MNSQKETPLMKQYNQIKSKYPETILFFRLGDFFETFMDDAVITAKVCGIVLTKRNNGAASGDMNLAGFPHHQLDTYLPKMVKAGYRVAVCEQLEDPKMAKGIVKRGVVEVVTPGAALYDKLLDSKKNNYIFSFILNLKESKVGIAFCDISTGEFQTAEIKISELKQLIEQVSPSEILISKAQKIEATEIIEALAQKTVISKLEDWIFDNSFGRDLLLKQFNTLNLKGFNIEGMNLGIAASGAILHYVSETQKSSLNHISSIKLFDYGGIMMLDYPTKRNLEIYYTNNAGGSDGSLISILDDTLTPQGGRLLKKWVSMPLTDLIQINYRLDCVESFFNQHENRLLLRNYLGKVCDLERMTMKICTARAIPKDFVILKDTLIAIKQIKELILQFGNSNLDKLSDNINSLDDLVQLISNTISEDAGVNVGLGNVFVKNYNAELDEYLDAKNNAKEWLNNFQNEERERSEIPSLKVGFNNVFGYYIEVTRLHSRKVPSNYHRKQTMTNAERYTTPELKQFETKILSAEDKINEIETNLFVKFRNEVAKYALDLMNSANIISQIDIFQSYAHHSQENNYCKPIINDSTELMIKNGRHPVVEKILPVGEQFIPNNSTFDKENGMIHLITGPNMSGKSCYLRQVGLIVLLGQIGCYVPAESATFGVVDKIFTRVGAQDNLTSGESTFLVEMQEASSILNNATDRSLILLDEVGRGTATYDGISIAKAMVEYITTRLKSKTLFATHYHELNELENEYEDIKNYKVDVIELESKILFSHKVIAGFSPHSFGLHVAKMAGMPQEVLERGEEILHELEGSGRAIKFTVGNSSKKKQEDINQLGIFSFQDDAIREKLRKMNIENITPIQALTILSEIINEAKK